MPALVFSVAAAWLLFAPTASADNSHPVAAADRAFVQAFEKKHPAALKEILDTEFICIDSNGERLNRAGRLENMAAIRNSDVEAQIHSYGDAVVVRADRGRMNALRIWVKRATAWRAVRYQEVLQVEKSKLRGTRSSPPELLSAERFDFGDTVMMVAREQRRGAKSYCSTRMWVKRDPRWQMLFSFNTRMA